MKTSDWGAVISLSIEAITRKSKDLQIAVWLGEAWVHLGGLAGFSQSIRLCDGLCERFWETLFPALEDGGAESRTNLLDWLDDVSARELRQIPLTEPAGASAAYCLADWETGLQLGSSSGRGRAPSNDPPPAVTHESFLARLSLTGYGRWASLKKEVDAAILAASALEATVTSRIEGASVLRRSGAALRAIAGIIEQGLKATIDDAPPGALLEAGLPGGGVGAADGAGRSGGPFVGSASSGGPITSRTDAYVRLTEAADYLLRTEPHSPVPYLVKRAISWGNMSLAELLYEFVGSTDDLVAIQRLLGMREKE